MKRYIVFALFLGMMGHLVAFAKSVNGIVLDDSGEPLVGAEIRCLGLSGGTTTDVNGIFTLDVPSGKGTLITSYIGFHSDTTRLKGQTSVTIVLVNNTILDEVTITEMKAAFLHSRTDAFNTTTLTAAQFCTAACCNLSESFENSASVDVSYSDAATGAKQIRLLGLSGIYVQMLFENTPGIRGLGQTYGMEYVPGPWINSIQISKGTSSVINGHEALTGQINIEFLKPHLTDPFAVNAMINHELHSELNLMGGWNVGKIANTSVLLHAQGMPLQRDHNGDGFLDMPQGWQVNLMNRWRVKKNNYGNQILVQAIYDRRLAGLTQDVQDKYKINYNRYAPYSDVQDKEKIDYDIDLRTRRISGFMKNGFVFDNDKDASLGIITAASYHSQNHQYGLWRNWDASQLNLYLNAIFQTDLHQHTEESIHHHQLSTGLSVNFDLYEEELGWQGPIWSDSLSDYPRDRLRYPSLFFNHLAVNFDRSELTPGIFAEYTYKYRDKITLLAGVRGDYSTTYGFFFTPRLNFRYAPAEWFTLRTNIGLGYRTPSLISDNSGWLASNKLLAFENIDKNKYIPNTTYMFDKKDCEQEQTLNTGLTLSFYVPIGNKTLQIFAEYYYTRFLKGTFIDLDRYSNFQNEYLSEMLYGLTYPFYQNGVSFYNLTDFDGLKAFSHTYQIEATMEVLRGWSLTAAFRYSDAKRSSFNTQTGQYLLRDIPLQSKYKAVLTTTYQTKLKKWQFDFTAQFNGHGRMQDNFTIPENSSQYYTRTRTKTDIEGKEQQIEVVYHKWFPQLMGQVTRYFRNASIYVGAENMTNFMQESPIQGTTLASDGETTSYINPYYVPGLFSESKQYDASSVWAPIHGWKIYIGFRYNLPASDNKKSRLKRHKKGGA